MDAMNNEFLQENQEQGLDTLNRFINDILVLTDMLLNYLPKNNDQMCRTSLSNINMS